MSENPRFASPLRRARNSRTSASLRSVFHATEFTARIEGLETRRLLAGEEFLHIDEGGVHGDHEVGAEAQVGARWTTTANGATGSTGNPITLTWGFVADGLSIPSGIGEPTAASNLQARLNAQYGSSAVWQPLFQNVFDRWSALTGLTYVFTGFSDDGAAFPQAGVTGGAAGQLGVRPDIRIGGHTNDGIFGNLAYNYFPNSGDMVIDTGDFAVNGYYTGTALTSRRLRNVVSHEHGHGLGLNHVDPVNNTKLMEATASTSPPYDGPQFDDIYAGQINYGDPFEKGGRNETAATASNLGTLVNGTNAVSSWVNANNPTSARSIANTGDFDYLKFTITGTKDLTFTVSPFGPTYTQGPQGGSTASFNASAQGNLSLAVFDTNGITALANTNTTGLGGSETISLTNLAAGTYFMRVSIASGVTQAYDVSISAADSVVIIAPPSTPNLDATSDSGTFNNDDYTNDNTPTFTGTAVAGSTVALFLGAAFVGSGIADGLGNWSITTATTIADGTWSFSATAQVGANISVNSPSMSITIDTFAPAAPTGLRIRADNDLGPFNSDNITSVAQPIFTGSSEANSQVTLSTPGGLVTVNGGANFLGTFSSAFTDGGRNVSAFTTDLAGNSTQGPPASIAIEIDTSAPTLSIAAFSRSPVQAMDFTFSENIFGTVNLVLTNALAVVIPTTLGLSGAATRRFFPSPANSLADGVYTMTLVPAGVTDLAGNVPASFPPGTFKFLRADFNGDNNVNFDDLLTIAQNYGLPGLTHTQGDANYDGAIDFGDLLIVAQTYGMSLVQTAASPTTTTPASRTTRSGVKRGNDGLFGTATAIV